MDKILDFLKKNFNEDILELKAIDEGERSKAFLFISRDKKYVFRINSHEMGFLKDQYAYKNFGEKVAIPEIIKIGKYKRRFFAISEYCEGITLSNNDLDFSNDLVESLIKTLNRIHSIKNSNKYGVADVGGNTEYKSWREWVLKDTASVTKNDGTFYTWDEIKKISFVDKSLIDNLIQSIDSLSLLVPNISSLIHGDFATGNVMIKNNQVTGVIDWNEFGYGDFLYDVAWLDFWIPKLNFVGKYLEYSQSKGKNIPDYFKRIKCHQAFIGLTALGLYATIGLKDTYNKIAKIIYTSQ